MLSAREGVELALEEDDVRRVFSRFGEVECFEQKAANLVVVTMRDACEALQAQQFLNFYQLPKSHAFLRARFLVQNEMHGIGASLQYSNRAHAAPLTGARKGEKGAAAEPKTECFSSSCTSQNKFTC